MSKKTTSIKKPNIENNIFKVSDKYTSIEFRLCRNKRKKECKEKCVCSNKEATDKIAAIMQEYKIYRLDMTIIPKFKN